MEKSQSGQDGGARVIGWRFLREPTIISTCSSKGISLLARKLRQVPRVPSLQSRRGSEHDRYFSGNANASHCS